MNYNLRLEKRNEKTFVLIDFAGAICGIYPTEKLALKAKPKIEKNLEFFYEHGQKVCLKRFRKKKRKFNSRKSRR